MKSPCYVGLKNERKKASHNLLNAITFETASTSLLLHLACGSVASPSTVTVASGGGEFDILLVDSWRVLGGGEGGHGVGEVQVGSDAELALQGGRVGRGGCQEGLLTGFFVNPRQVRVDQGIEELNNELGVVRDLCLL